MYDFIIIFHVIVCFFLIVIVLLQSGRGAELGASLGAGASQTVFGAGGGSNFFTKATTVLAVLFMVNSITLTYMKAQEVQKSVFDDEPAKIETSAPALNLAPTTESSSETTPEAAPSK